MDGLLRLDEPYRFVNEFNHRIVYEAILKRSNLPGEMN